MPTKASSRNASIQCDFLVPTYYSSFVCKGGACRNTCCSGWGVTIPRDQYYTLLGVDCDPLLRDKLDRTFRPLENATVDRYAEIIHTFEGRCPLHMDNGYCMLHSQLGEAILPSVCRYYPRGPRTEFALECSCSNSCERTLELLLTDESPIQWETKQLAFQMQTFISQRTNVEKEMYQRIRSLCFQLLQNREVAFPTRLLRMGKLLKAMDHQEALSIESLEHERLSVTKDIPRTYSLLFRIIQDFIDTDTSLAEDLKAALRFFQNGSIQENYDSLSRHFNQVLPNHEVLFEKMILNHLMFAQFPFRENATSFYDEFVAVCGIYLLVRFLSLVQMREKDRLEDFVDIIAKLFRVIAHTPFERNILILLQRQSATDLPLLAQMIQA